MQRKTLVAVSRGSDKIVLRMNKLSSVGRKGQPESTNSKMNVSSDRSVLGSKNHLMFRARRTMLDLLMIVVRWLAGLGSGGDLAVRPKCFLPPVRAVCSLRRGNNPAVDAILDIGWMAVRLDSLSCVRVLSGSSPARRGSTTHIHYPALRRGIGCSFGFCAVLRRRPSAFRRSGLIHRRLASALCRIHAVPPIYRRSIVVPGTWAYISFAPC